MTTIPHDFQQVLSKFLKKYLPNNVSKFDVQEFYKPSPKYPNGLWGYFEKKRKLMTSDWLFHFFTSPKNEGGKIVASLSLSELSENLNWISIDIDNLDQMAAWKNKLKPILDLKGWEYFIEWGGDQDEDSNYNRCHVLIFFESLPISLIKDFTRQLFYDIGEPVFKDEFCHFPHYDGKSATAHLFDEIFPINKPNNKVRPPGGYHYKRGKRYPCQYKDSILDTPLDIMWGVINCNPISEQEIKDYIKKETIEKLNTKLNFKDRLIKSKDHNGKYKPWFYTPINLPTPIEELPSKLVPAAKNCQALNSLLKLVAEAKYIETPGSTHHDAQLLLRGATKYLDAQFKYTEGEDFYNYLRDNYRFRDDTSHNLEGKDHENSPFRYFANCKTWHEYFGLCEGCIYKDQITSPRAFIFGKPIKREIQGRIELTTLEKIRTEDFPKLQDYLVRTVENEHRKTLLFAHSQGSGKSTSIVRGSILRLARLNYKLLVAVPNTDLAIEYRDYLKENGVDSFILASHKSMFDPSREKRITTKTCPFFEEIQELNKLGVDSGTIKAEFCNNCQLLDECPYPRQYAEVQDPAHRVVIIQHAHFSCQEVIYDLVSKGFDVLYIDESFIESVFKFLPIPKRHILALRSLESEWSDTLADWLDCKADSDGKMKPDEIELETARTLFKEKHLEWVVPDYIRFYRQRRTVNKISGIEVIYELPDVPTKVLTDATAPLILTKQLTGIDNIEVYGENTILDIKTVHPDNEIIQVLDFTSSVTGLSDDITFNLILERIALEVNSTDTESRSLITAYKNDHGRIQNYFGTNHPTLLKKIQLGAITKGVNKYLGFDRQYILANRLFLGKDFLIQAYKYIQVANYYRKKKGLELITNIYPLGLDHTSTIETVWETVYRKENGKLLEYPQFKLPKPALGADEFDDNFWYRLIYEYNVGEVQQAIRIRPTKEKPVTITILNNVHLPSTNITKSLTLDQWLNS